jgi:hypothetical protein
MCKRSGKGGIAVVWTGGPKRGGRKRRASLMAGIALALSFAWSASAQPPVGPLAPPTGPLAPPAPVQTPKLPVPIGPPPAANALVPSPPVSVPPPSPAPPPKPPPRISILGRFQRIPEMKMVPLPGNVTAYIVTGGVTMFMSVPSATPAGATKFLDIEADRVVIWSHGNDNQSAGNLTSPGGAESDAYEVYMAGNVEMRTRGKADVDTLRGDEIYYDVRRAVAVVRKADVEIMNPKISNPIHLKAAELIQDNAKTYTGPHVQVFSSLLPSDPGLTVDVDNMRVEERTIPKTYLYGLWTPASVDGKPVTDTQRYFTGTNMITRIDGVPVFYWPYLSGRVERPLGPLEGISFGYDEIFGFEIKTTWDLFDLLDLPKPAGMRWRLYLDYLSERGPGIGTDFDFTGKDVFGIKGNYSAQFKAYAMSDRGVDDLAPNRGIVENWPDANTTWPVTQPDFRGFITGKFNAQELPDGFSVISQFAFVSDRNFIEAYYLNTQLNEPNLDTFIQVKQQQANMAWTFYGQVSTRDWLTETNWLPKADGYLLGQTFSLGQWEDFIVSNTHVSAGFAQLLPTIQVPFAYSPLDVHRSTARLDVMQDFSMPFYLGALKVVPYVIGDAAFYSEDVDGNTLGRVYGGAGIRWDLPLSRLYPDVHSELFNLDGLYHKINLLGNYYASQSSTSLNNLPQLDRFNDDATDQALRDIHPLQSLLNPSYANYLNYSQLFTPQNYALRRLIMDTPDALDTMNVLQLGIDQRLQTKRGMPGDEHVVDWMTLNVGVSIFPHSLRDNFGRTFGIAEYDWTWNIGDRTSLMSSGWWEPFQGGPDVFDIGIATKRPDQTSFYLGYRQIDPVNSKAVVATVIYPLSAKYAVAANTVWDFGDQVRTYSLYVSRMGTDVMVNFGVQYNSTLNTFGVTLEILPNLARSSSRANGYFPAALTNIDPMVNVR